jgi:pimeloyl-ACP methyl ester carboxylesterase
MYITANGIRMRYEIAGQGPALVLIHGFSDNLRMWYNQVPAFAAGRTVLTYDVRGFGETDKRGPYSMDVFADDLGALLKSLGIASACILGYSMGGRVGLHLAFRRPDVVTGLVFANSGVGAKVTPEREARWRMMMEVIGTGNREAIAEMMAVGSFSPDFKERDPATFQRYKAVKMENDPSSYLEILQAMMADTTQVDDLQRVSCPALVIAGEQDGFMDLALGRAMQAALPAANLAILPAGHAAALEIPDAFNEAVLTFLSSVPARA